MEKILAFDTTADILQVTLKDNGKIYENIRRLGLRHNELLLPTIDALLKEAELTIADLDLIVCPRGPGSFTGLRIGMSCAKGLAAAYNTPIAAVDTLKAHAWKFRFSPVPVIPVLDARKKRIYTAVYEQGSLITKILDIAPVALLEYIQKDEPVILCGSHPQLAAEFFPNAQVFQSEGLGLGLIETGLEEFSQNGPLSADAGPNYYRKSEAEENG
jgi:tRNA threonylcarbamoyladenosine biosynthesis protein TsaB